MTYEELVQRIVLSAQTGGKRLEGYDSTAVVEAFLPTLFQEVGMMLAADERKRSLLRRHKTITMAAGIGTIPTDVLTQHLGDSTLFDPADPTKEYSLVKDWFEFFSPLDNRLGYYVVKGETTLLQREPNEVYTSPLSFTGEMTLVASCAPVIPTLHTDSIDANPEVLAVVVERGAAKLRGGI